MDSIYISNIYTRENNFILNKLDTLWDLLHQTLIECQNNSEKRYS